MAKEKFIHGKHDDAHHVGLYHNRKVEQQYTDHLKEELDFINSLSLAQRRAYLYGEWDYENERPWEQNEVQLRGSLQD